MFKVGDRVKIIGCNGGTAGTIIYDDGSNFCQFLVAIDGYTEGHGYNEKDGRRIERNDGYWLSLNNLELITPAPAPAPTPNEPFTLHVNPATLTVIEDEPETSKPDREKLTEDNIFYRPKSHLDCWKTYATDEEVRKALEG